MSVEKCFVKKSPNSTHIFGRTFMVATGMKGSTFKIFTYLIDITNGKSPQCCVTLHGGGEEEEEEKEGEKKE